MEFALSEDQRMLSDTIGAMLKSEAPLDTVREIVGGDAAKAATLESGLAEFGLAGIVVPEAHGGLGLGLLDAALVQEALGHSVAPEAFAATVIATYAILAGASDKQQSEWLPAIASGEARFGVAISELVGRREGALLNESDGLLRGKSLFAIGIEKATHILVTAEDGALHVIDAASEGVQHQPLNTIDKTRVFTELLLKDVEASHLKPGAGDLALRAARILTAADTLGASQAMLEQAVAYARERKQFGRVIGSFQAVKHLCAEMAAKIEPARALIWHAAYAFDTRDEEAAVMACLAKAHLAEIGTFVARTSTEVHGGMGFTDLVGLHYWFKRIGVNRQLFGGPEQVRTEAALLQGWG